MAFWGIPTEPEQTSTEVPIDALSNQISFLADKIEEVEGQLRVEKAEADTEEE